MTEKAIATRPEPSPLQLILANPEALKELDVDKVRELAELHMRMEAEAARKSFAIAFVGAQAEFTPIVLKGKNSHTNSLYARAQDVVKMIHPILVRHGFSRSFSTEPTEGDLIRFKLTLRHVDGHVEQHFMEAPADVKGPKGGFVKTELHGRASSMTYCERVLTCKVFGLQLGGDDDGNAGAGVQKPELVAADDVAELNALADRAGIDKAGACTFYRIQSLAQMTVKDARTFRHSMKKRIANQEAQEV